ncbi:MAG: hypothetical protein Kow00133_15140 [Amphiplicatus sp.]
MTDIAREISLLLRRGRIGEAETLGGRIIGARPDSAEAWVLAARIAQHRGDFAAMLERARRARILDGRNMIARLQEAEALVATGQAQAARAQLAELEGLGEGDVAILLDAANLYTHAGLYEDAARCCEKAAGLDPADPKAHYNHAAALIALGRLDEATALLDRVIELDPHDYDAYYNRSTLKTQTRARNHIGEMEALVAAGLRHPRGLAPIGYALAKEYEDIGDYEAAFAWLKRGADARRRGLSYDVAQDVATMRAIAAVYDAAEMRRPVGGFPDAAPIFILGLPRSGTTLVDRIISAHSQAASLGEINDFALAMVRLAGPVADKAALVRRSARIDFAELGRLYETGVRGRGRPERRLIDKTPANFLYIGLIVRALPNATILHVRRNPMDSCYAMYKTLFRMGYPFSYDFDDLAAYYVAYRELMDHWRRVAPGRIVDVDYETLVTDQHGTTARILEVCGLPWEDACLRFHENASAAPTASAAQVRRPLYATSVRKWRRYEKQLEPLRCRLEAAGIDVDS